MEIWKDIPGWEGKYQVSTIGDIKSLNYLRTGQERLLKIFRNNNGYMFATLWAEGKPKMYLVHRLVALTFIKNIENKSQINHKNGIKTDNRVDNLEWNTQSENMLHAHRTGLCKRTIINPLLPCTQ